MGSIRRVAPLDGAACAPLVPMSATAAGDFAERPAPRAEESERFRFPRAPPPPAASPALAVPAAVVGADLVAPEEDALEVAEEPVRPLTMGARDARRGSSSGGLFDSKSKGSGGSKSNASPLEDCAPLLEGSRAVVLDALAGGGADRGCVGCFRGAAAEEALSTFESTPTGTRGAGMELDGRIVGSGCFEGGAATITSRGGEAL